MIEFKNVSIKYVNDFYSLLNSNLVFDKSYILINDETFSRFAIMRLISKIDKKYEGEIFVDSTNLKLISDKNLPIAYCPTKPELFNSKIFNNLIYPLKLRKINKNIAKNTVNSIINKYLFNFSDKINKLNNSQKKIVALVRALVRKPKYVLLEDFFDDLDKDYFDLATQIIYDHKDQIFIISSNKNFPKNLNFKTISLS